MAKMFYTSQEAAERLGKSEEEIKELVRAGSLREFRDAGTINYRVEDVDALAAESSSSQTPSSSASGEIVLEPVEDSSIELTPSGSDILSLEEVDSEDTSATTAAGKEDTVAKKKGDTVVPSVGVNVFDDDDLDEVVDPLAQTAVTDVGGLGHDSIGSGTGILDLTKEESDDTSLGAELLDEIYGGEEEGDAVEMGEDTRAGLDEALPEEAEPEEAPFDAGVEAGAAGPKTARPGVVGTGAAAARPDALATGLTALMVVAVVVMWFAGLAGAALVRGIVPSLLDGVYRHLVVYAGGAVGVAVIVGAVTFLLARRAQ